MSWSASQYVTFEDERTRPVRDLLHAIPPGPPVHAALDLGCGPGNSTELLAARFPQAEVTGLDSSADMIAAARRRLPDLRFSQADIATWDAPGPYGVLLANAVLQWLPDHAGLLPRLLSRLAPGGSLAVQMPDNLQEPAHRLMREVAALPSWAARLAPVSGVRTEIAPESWYFDLLRPHCTRVDIWRTIYQHPLAGVPAVVEWFKGSGLRPFLEKLDPPERAAFLQHYTAALAGAYPALADGTVLLPFPRLFIVATR